MVELLRHRSHRKRRQQICAAYSHRATSRLYPICDPIPSFGCFVGEAESGHAAEFAASVMTRLYGPAVRCKSTLSIWRERFCIDVSDL